MIKVEIPLKNFLLFKIEFRYLFICLKIIFEINFSYFIFKPQIN